MHEIALPAKTTGTCVGERRKNRRYRLISRVDLLMPGVPDVYWGSMRNVSWRGVALSARQFLKSGQRLTLRFRFHDAEQREVIESLAAKVMWRTGDDMGLEFDPPLATDSPALRQAPFLVAHLMMKEA